MKALAGIEEQGQASGEAALVRETLRPVLREAGPA